MHQESTSQYPVPTAPDCPKRGVHVDGTRFLNAALSLLQETMVIMSRQLGRMTLLLAVCLLMLGTIYESAWAGGPPGQEISLVNISQTTEFYATAVPQVAVSRVDPNLVAVAWRKYGLPINTNAGAAPGERTADCHVAVSTDGGQTFHDTDLMPMLRQHTDPELPTEPAPGLFSTTTDLPSRSERCGATARPPGSGPMPGR